MTLPALIVFAAFASGIALRNEVPAPPAAWLALTVTALLAGFGLLLRRRDAVALAFGTLAWLFLGGLAASLERAAVPENHVTRLIATGRLDPGEPLRWRGQLRSDPLSLPWGFRYEIDLDEVEIAGLDRAVTGGLRVSYFRNEREPASLPALRAGDRVEALVRARPPRNFGNPGAFDARTHLARQGVDLTGSLRSTELLRKVGEPPLAFSQRMARLRGRLLEQVDAMFAASPSQAAVLKAMLLGDRSFVDHELAEAFQKTAVYHVLVISGLHVAALVVFLVWCGRRLRLSLAQITCVTLVVLFAFVSLVEDRPPIARAAAMATVFLLSRLLFRRVDLLNTLATSALLILAARPSALADPSFQLSFLAAGLIGALGLPWVEKTSGPYRTALSHLGDVTRDTSHPPRAIQFRLDLRALAGWLAARLPQRLANRASSFLTAPVNGAFRLWEVALISAAIQLGMLPVMAHYFHRVTPVGPLANIPASLLSGLMVPVGYLTLLLGMAWDRLGSLLVPLLGGITTALTGSVEWFSTWRWNSYRIPAPPVWLLIAFFAALVLLSVAARKPRSSKLQRLCAAPLVLLAIAVVTYPFGPRFEPGRVELTVLDVGQGDAIFAAFPDGRTLLVDGGGMFGATRVGGFRTGFDVGEQVVSPYLWQRGWKRIDVVALTHAHQDHLDGLNAVLENFRVGELWVGREVDSPAFRELVERAAARGTRVVHRKRGEHFEWAGVTGLVLWPEGVQGVAVASNNDSLVLRLDHGGVSFLLPGDIEKPVELELAARGDPLDVDLLKVPHHGSRSSTTSELVVAATPQAAVISVGEANPFGHPHRELLERLRGPGVRVLRTDLDGAVTAVSDGKTLRVHGYAATNH